MRSTTINIYQSFLIPLQVDSKAVQKEFFKAQNALQKLKKIELKIFDTLSSVMEIKKMSALPIKLRPYWNLHKKYLRKEVYYKFSIKIIFKDKYYEDLEKRYKENSNYFFLKHILPNDIEKRFYDFIMVLNICRIGGYHCGVGLIKSSAGIKPLKEFGFYSIELYEWTIEKKWPKFENLKIKQIWEWYLNAANPNGIDELSSTRLSRALNAYSYLYEDSAEISKLFWTMVGIEALYVKGKEGLAEQIKQKAQLYLGEIEEFKKRLSQMYEFRSAFIHGSKNFPSYFHIHDAIESFEKFNSEFYEVLLIAQSMLIATLQKMAKEKKKDLSFKYTVD